MTVAELIKELREYPPGTTVFVTRLHFGSMGSWEDIEEPEPRVYELNNTRVLDLGPHYDG